ncbi:hypothetical protein QWY31_08790 [Cytophagales bacterium LB-30]|uniref:Uncharacterized protein n=1 Tax=Shiella aurantiaca TaxID=3058365 RepID=A0ABT8F5U3_9BACT|nr:hypothetical protein [Shiella aurantiaca]MDN4165596.1 hypothetical protein [Shiella aurantiaca]
MNETFSKLDAVVEISLISKNFTEKLRVSLLVDNEDLDIITSSNVLFSLKSKAEINKEGCLSISYDFPIRVKHFDMVLKATQLYFLKNDSSIGPLELEIYSLFGIKIINNSKLFILDKLIQHPKVTKVKFVDGELYSLSNILKYLAEQNQIYMNLKALGYNEKTVVKLLNIDNFDIIKDVFQAISEADLTENAISLEAINPAYESLSIDALSRKIGYIKAIRLAKHFFKSRKKMDSIQQNENMLLQSYITQMN